MKTIKRNKLLRCALITYLCLSVALVFWLPQARKIEDSDPRLSADQGPGMQPIYNIIPVSHRNRTLANNTKRGEHDSCTFEGTFEENLQKLRNLKFPNSTYLMDKLGFNGIPKRLNKTSLPVLVTGINERFYGVLQGLVKSVHKILLPKYPELKFIIYDMGMADWQHEQVVKYCRCEVRRLPFKELPAHVRTLGNFAFKPIVANYIFQEYGTVWWVDSSVRFLTNDLEKPLKYLEDNGALFFTYDPVLNVALHTHKDTFRYFEEDPCPYMYFGEIEAGNVAFINNDVGRLIMNRWVSCALDASCITPERASKGCRSPERMGENYIGACHRYDQSVLSIILRRLYHEQNDYPFVDKPFRIVQVIRGQTVNYFPPKR